MNKYNNGKKPQGKTLNTNKVPDAFIYSSKRKFIGKMLLIAILIAIILILLIIYFR